VKHRSLQIACTHSGQPPVACCLRCKPPKVAAPRLRCVPAPLAMHRPVPCCPCNKPHPVAAPLGNAGCLQHAPAARAPQQQPHAPAARAPQQPCACLRRLVQWPGRSGCCCCHHRLLRGPAGGLVGVCARLCRLLLPPGAGQAGGWQALRHVGVGLVLPAPNAVLGLHVGCSGPGYSGVWLAAYI